MKSRFREALKMLAAALLRMAHQGGWPALAGGMLLVASIAIVLSATEPTRAQIASLEQQRKQLRAPVDAPGSAQRAVAPLSPQAQLQNFYASFPARSTLPAALMQLHRVANRVGLKATRADYRDTVETGTPLVRIKIEIPVSGSYGAIRIWIAELLKALPSLTLEGLDLKRSDIGKPQLDARVRFQLLLRSGS